MAADDWRLLGKSVRGASHVRSSLPNQDAIGWLPEGGAGLPLILAVSDGHGSAKSFRSDRGARFAVQAMLAELGHLLDSGAETQLSAIKRMSDSHLPQLLVRHWEEEVRRDLEAEPFSDAEWQALEKKDGQSARLKVEANPLLAYGATVVAALVGRGFLLFLQLGDGDVLVVGEDGAPRRPLPKDERLIANETTSLCSPHAAREFRVGFLPLTAENGAESPVLVLVSTDGYANSFRDEAGFLQVGPDILDMICDDGLEKVGEQMEEWLNQASQVGSGDDITLGLICRTDGLAAYRARRPAPAQPSP